MRAKRKSLKEYLAAAWLEARGWHEWYRRGYWVSPKTVRDPSAQDYTNYGMSTQEAVAYERETRQPFSRTPMAGLRGSGARQNSYNRKK